MNKRILVFFALPLLTVAIVGVAQAQRAEASTVSVPPHRAIASEVSQGARCLSDPSCLMSSF